MEFLLLKNTKLCRYCKVEKLLENFGIKDCRKLKNGSTSIFYQPDCKSCKKLLRNKDRTRQLSNEYYTRNSEKCKQYSAKVRLNNPEYYKKYGKKWRKANSAKTCEYASSYRSRKTSSNILINDEWNSFIIQEMYNLRKIRSVETGIEWHVDHVIPLKGTSVSGLHVWYNLQVIPASLNLAKSNKY